MKFLGTDHYWRDWTITDGMVFSPPDWQVAIANGSRFAFLKCADGIDDSVYFHEAFDSARSAGLLVGAYAWLDARWVSDPKRQAEKWFDVLRGLSCPLSIDFEAYGDNIPSWNDLYDAAVYFRQLDPTRRIGVYTNYYYWMAHGNPDPSMADVLQFNWSARYYHEPPRLYAPWNRTDIWQFSGSGDPKKYGITNGKLAVDENYWMGDEASLLEFFNQDVLPPGETTMDVKANFKVNIRADHYITAADVGDLQEGQTLPVLELWETGAVKGVDYEQWAKVGSGWVAVWFKNLGSGGKLCDLTGTLPPPTGSVMVSVYANGAKVHSKDVPAGGTVRVDITD
jgi:hypothetical protein